MALWSLKGKKILIIDDFAEMRSTLRNMLIPFSAEDITVASNGEDAIELINENRYDIILCDYNLGDGKDGQQILEEAKLRGKLPYASVFIMVTAESTSFMVMGALEHQPDDYLSKPFTRNVLQSRIEKLLNKKSSLVKLSTALEQENYALAIQLCDEAIISTPTYRTELLRIKTDMLISEQQLDAACSICDEIIAERNLPWARLSRGRIYFLQKDYDSAKTLFESIISDNPAYVSAYDWLAKTQLKLGDTATAQKTIEEAVGQSGKSINRQRMLAEISEANKDYTTAEKARRKSIKNSKNSILRDASDYTKLAEALSKNDNPKEAFKAIEVAKLDFKDDEQAQIAVALARSHVYQDMGQENEALAAIEEASTLLQNTKVPIKNELAIELTESFLAHGKTEAADAIVKQLVSNNHDNQELLDKVSQVYTDSDSNQSADELVDGVRKEIIATNNKGVKLLESGNIDDAIALFEQALQNGPNNQALNMNSAQAYLMRMKAQGKNGSLLERTRNCLDKISDNPDLQKRYKMLNAAYWKTFNKK